MDTDKTDTLAIFLARGCPSPSSEVPLTPDEREAFMERLKLVWPYNPSVADLEEFARRANATIKALEAESKGR